MRLLRMRGARLFALYCVADVVCVGMGMGVPILCIALGFVVGWVLVRCLPLPVNDLVSALRKILRGALLTAGVTFGIMAVLWGHCVLWFFDPASDYANFGHPFILYDPKRSFIAWLVLMVIISPFLQLLTTVFSAFPTLALVRRSPVLLQRLCQLP